MKVILQSFETWVLWIGVLHYPTGEASFIVSWSEILKLSLFYCKRHFNNLSSMRLFFFGRLWCTFVNFEISSESPVDVKESCTTMVSYFDLKFRLYLTTSIYTEYYGLKTTYSTPLKWTIWIHFLPRILFFLDEGEQFYKRFNRMKSSQYNRRVCLDVLGWQSFCSQSP